MMEGKRLIYAQIFSLSAFLITQIQFFISHFPKTEKAHANDVY